MRSSPWREYLEELLRGRATPVLVALRKEGAYIIAGGPLWITAIDRKRALARAGIRSGSIVIDRSPLPDALINLVACAIGGYIYWPLSPTIELATRAGEVVPPPVPTYEITSIGDEPRLVTALGLSLPNAKDLADTVLLLSSSGTQSRKTIGFSGAALRYQVEHHYSALSPIQRGRRLIMLPHTQAFGLILDLFVGLRSEQHIFIPPPGIKQNQEALQLIMQKRIGDMALVPRQLALLVLAAKRHKCEHVLQNTQIHTGGAPVLETLQESASTILRSLRIGYGLTECGPGVLLDGEPIGCDVVLSPLTEEGLSEILVRTPSLGVASPPLPVTNDGYVLTGDLARVNRGKIEVTGRRDDSLKLSDGVWTTKALFIDKVVRVFELDALSLRLTSEPTMTFVSRPGYSKDREQALVSYVERSLGYTVQYQRISSDYGNIALLEQSRAKDLAGALDSLSPTFPIQKSEPG